MKALTMTGNPADSVGLTSFGTVTLRDLTINAGDFFGLACLDPGTVTLCNVTLRASGHDGITWSPNWPSGKSSSLKVYDSTLTQSSTVRSDWGIGLFCWERAGDVTAEIFNSTISGCSEGVDYSNGFSDNDANVRQSICSPTNCTPQEECP